MSAQKIGSRQQASKQKVAQREAYMAALKKQKPFTMPATDKKIVVTLGYASAIAGRGHARYSNSQHWHEIRVDSDARVQPDILLESLTHIPALPDNSVDAVYCGHLLQRLTYNDAALMIKEALRILKDGGELLVTTPDMQLAAVYVANMETEAEIYHSPAGPVSALDMLFGFQKFIQQGDTARSHRSGFTPEMLGKFLRDNGVCNLTVQCLPYDIIAIGRKLPYQHPERVERIMVQSRQQQPKPPAIDKLPKQDAPQMVRFADTLETEPQLWKPLGLSKKA